MHVFSKEAKSVYLCSIKKRHQPYSYNSPQDVLVADSFLDSMAHTFLPLDESVASRAVFVTVPGSDGRAGGNSQNREETVCINGELIETHGHAIEWAHPKPS